MTRLIQIAETEADTLRCFDVMHELRPHLTRQEFIERVARQRAQGYHLAFLECEGVVRSVTGYRLLENLAWGRMMHVDDLVTCGAGQGGGFGSALLDWLIREAKLAGCAQLHLDSGVQRFGAHRFYLHKGLDITCHHFALKF